MSEGQQHKSSSTVKTSNDLAQNKRAKNKLILHIGFGAFHRAHQLAYAQELVNAGFDGWKYCVASLNGTKDIESLRQQDHQFHILEQHADGERIKKVEVVKESIHPKLDGLDFLLNKIADPKVKIISLTITEKGYCLKKDKKLPSPVLNLKDESIQYDLLHPESPRSAIGILVRGLALRKEKNGNPLSLLSCDELAQNGNALKSAVLGFAEQVDNTLVKWIISKVTFPSSMVDRIVPLMTKSSRTHLSSFLQQPDACGIVCESFKQWVIEDDFIDGRPQWEKVGAIITSKVDAYENMKVRMLGGAYSLIAYAGFLAGFETVCEAVKDKEFRLLVWHLMVNEQAPTLEFFESFEVQRYAQSLLERFENPYLHHQIKHLAIDGSQKIPQSLLASLEINYRNSKSCPILTFVLASWVRYVAGADKNGVMYTVIDPLAECFNRYYMSYGLSLRFAKKVLQMTDIFPRSLQENENFVTSVCAAYLRICENGIAHELSALSGLVQKK